jgi:acyl-CoA synthetase (NDP forming)
MSEFNAKMSLVLKEILWKNYIPHFETVTGTATAFYHAIRYYDHLKNTDKNI